jgi:hypothetical protein
MRVNRSQYSSLTDAVTKLKIEIDEAAGKARLRYITSVPGQEAVYLEKMSQAKAYLAEIIEPTDMTGYEYIEAEATATGMTRQAVAERINSVAVLWNTTISPQIESLRISSKDQLDALTGANTVQDAVTIARAAIATLNSI